MFPSDECLNFAIHRAHQGDTVPQPETEQRNLGAERHHRASGSGDIRSTVSYSRGSEPSNRATRFWWIFEVKKRETPGSNISSAGATRPTDAKLDGVDLVILGLFDEQSPQHEGDRSDDHRVPEPGIDVPVGGDDRRGGQRQIPPNQPLPIW